MWRSLPAIAARLHIEGSGAARALTVEFLKKADKPELAKLVLDHSSVLPEETLVQKIQAANLMSASFTR
jgi:hypothetical protein